MPMMGWPMGGWYGGGLIGMLVMLASLALIVAGVILVARWTFGEMRPGGGRSGGESALDILERRYARGEIGKEEFERMKADLR